MSLALPSPAPADTIDSATPLAEVAAYVQAKAAFQRNCFRCHTTGGEESSKRSMERLDMSRYPFTGKRGPTAGRSVKKAVGGGGVKAAMPKDDPESLSGEDLVAILKWADVFESSRAPKDKEKDKESRPETSREPAPREGFREASREVPREIPADRDRPIPPRY